MIKEKWKLGMPRKICDSGLVITQILKDKKVRSHQEKNLNFGAE
jgi:hypothetical protein